MLGVDTEKCNLLEELVQKLQRSLTHKPCHVKELLQVEQRVQDWASEATAQLVKDSRRLLEQHHADAASL